MNLAIDSSGHMKGLYKNTKRSTDDMAALVATDHAKELVVTGGMFSIAMTAPGVKYLNSNK